MLLVWDMGMGPLNIFGDGSNNEMQSTLKNQPL